MIASGHTTRPDAIVKSQETEITKDALRPSRNVFDRLGQRKEEDMRTHLEARHSLATFRRRKDLLVVSPINNEKNELRARLKKLAAINTKAAQSTLTLLFSAKRQQAPLPARFRMSTIATYEGKIDPQDYLDAFNDRMDLLQVTTLARYGCFVVTLSRTTKKWIRQIEPETIISKR